MRRRQGLLTKLSTESAASSAALLAGHDDCARLQEHTALLSKQFSRAAMQARAWPHVARTWPVLGRTWPVAYRHGCLHFC